MASPYKLSCVIFGHTSDVRSIAVTLDNRIISGSRDKTAKLWVPNRINVDYTEAERFLGHTNFVSAVCYVAPESEHPEGLIVTGSNDNTICIYEPSSSTLLLTLKGHSSNVCSLSAGLAGTFLSASWDKTAKYWKTDGSTKPITTLAGHQAAVWSVIQLSSGTIVTGSADQTIKVWSTVGDCLITFTGHTDCVRGLAATSATTFLSVSNDATIRHWNATTGACLDTLYGHTNYIYSVATIPDSGFISSGEDWTVRVWQGGECVQTITLPAQSIWSVATLHNGDIVAGSSDGMIRVFSRDTSRQMNEESLRQFEEEVLAVHAASQKGVDGININELPGGEALTQAGTKDGQTKLVREGDIAVCYSWSLATQAWEKVGDVMGASGATQQTSGKQLYQGQEYDFVFNVDIEEGKPPLKLPYNSSVDPWSAAQTFIHANNLSQLFLDQVANFIVDNSKQAQPATSAAPTSFGDPLTGGARYIPGAGTVGAPGADPFTGANRYVPPGSTPVPPPSNGVASSASADSLTKPYFPQRSYLRFDQANVAVIQDKLTEFNVQLDEASHRVTDAQIAAVCKLVDVEAGVDLGQVQVLQRLLTWPEVVVFPALDVMRLAVRNAKVNHAMCGAQFGERLFELLRDYLSPTSQPANQMLAARTVCNMMSQTDGETLALKHCEYLLQAVEDFKSPHTKNMQVALATLLVNLSVAVERTGNAAGRSRGVQVVASVLPSLSDSEAQFRALVALGTLIWEAESAEDQERLKRGVRDSAEMYRTLDKLANMYVVSPTSNEAKAANCAAQVLALVQI